jgi:hypothetical protein
MDSGLFAFGGEYGGTTPPPRGISLLMRFSLPSDTLLRRRVKTKMRTSKVGWINQEG